MDWFRLYAEFATDPKVQMMSEATQRRLLMLFCLQCSNGIETFHETERETAIAFALRISEADMAETKEVFLRRGFINEDWTLANWNKRQYVSDSSTARVRKHREAKKQTHEKDETLPKRSGNASEQIQNRTDTEQIKEKPAPAAQVQSLTAANLIALGVGKQVANEFLAIRKKKRSSLTDIALAGIQREAHKVGWTLDQTLRKCVERGWQGFEADWVDKPRGGTQPDKFDPVAFVNKNRTDHGRNHSTIIDV